MDEQLFKILKKVYYKKQYRKDQHGYQQAIETGDVYDLETKTYQYSIDTLSPAELSMLQQSKYPFNEIFHNTHDPTIQKLKNLVKHKNLSLCNLLSAYIAGFHSFPRGRQPIISYLFAKAVPVHSFNNSRDGRHCEICALPKECWVEKGRDVFRLYWGYAWSEMPEHFLADLEEFSKFSPILPTQEDIKIFLAVIDMIRTAPTEEYPGKLEQRIMKAKIIPNCEKYRLRGQLLALSELGVMPNEYVRPLFDGFTDFATRCNIDVPGSSRSDVILPLSGWRGKNGICEERYIQLFDEMVSKCT